MTEKPDLIEVFRSYDVEVRDGRIEQLVCCPVHSESHPSCSVNLIKGLWSCKACSAQGDAYTLIMLKEGIDFAAAVEHGRKHFGADGPGRAPQQRGRMGLNGTRRSGGFRPAFGRRKGLARQ